MSLMYRNFEDPEEHDDCTSNEGVYPYSCEYEGWLDDELSLSLIPDIWKVVIQCGTSSDMITLALVCKTFRKLFWRFISHVTVFPSYMTHQKEGISKAIRMLNPASVTSLTCNHEALEFKLSRGDLSVIQSFRSLQQLTLKLYPRLFSSVYSVGDFLAPLCEKLQKLHLSGYYGVESLPFEYLTNLTELSIDSEFIPEETGQRLLTLTNLRHLKIFVIKQPVAPFRVLTNLETLYLGAPDTSESDVDTLLQCLTGLREFSFRNSHCDLISLLQLTHLVKLELVRSRYLDQMEHIKMGIRQNTNLIRLKLVDCHLAKNTLKIVSALTNLTELSVSSVVSSQKVNLEYIHGLVNLTCLHMIGYKGFSMEHLSGLSNLKELDLSGTSPSSDSLVSLKNMTSLTKLNISRMKTQGDINWVPSSLVRANFSPCNGISATTLRTLYRFSRLASLEITCYKWSNKKLAHVGSLPMLKDLTIYGDGNISRTDGISSLVNLRMLHMKVSVVPEGWDCLRYLTNLTSLTMRKIPKQAFPYLRDLTRLEILAGGAPDKRDVQTEDFIQLCGSLPMLWSVPLCPGSLWTEIVNIHKLQELFPNISFL